MNVAQVAAEIFKREGVTHLFAYPLNALTESCAAVGIHPVIVRQERAAGNIADAVARMTSGEMVPVVATQHGPGIENLFAAVAQAYAEGVPMVIVPAGYPRRQTWVSPNFNSALNFQHVTKACEQVTTVEAIVPALRRAFTQARQGRPGPVLVEVPIDMWTENVPGELVYEPMPKILTAPDSRDVSAVAEALLSAKRPLLYAGQGVHYSKAWDALKKVAELLEAPVTTSLGGKSSFPETHPLSLGSGGVAMPAAVHQHVVDSDVVFGIGASFTETSFGIRFPTQGKKFLQNTNDPSALNRSVPTHRALLGDSRLALEMLYQELSDRLKGKPRGLAGEVAARIRSQNDPWLKEWSKYMDSNATPLSPYRVIRDIMNTVDVPNTIVTHDAGSPRDELSPFWKSVTPLSYIGWGKSTQLGYGLGLAMGAKLARPDKLCMNFWGDAAIGMTGMDFETAVRFPMPILSILFNNFGMAMEFDLMKVSREKFKSTDISGNYADWAKSLGGFGLRVTEPSQIIPAIKAGVEATRNGQPALLEFITTQEKVYSTWTHKYGS